MVRQDWGRLSHCKNHSFPADATLGLEKDYTSGLTRLVTRCCGFRSYRLSAESHEKFCGIHLSHTTLGKIAGPTAEEIAERLATHPDIRHDFQKAKGEWFDRGSVQAFGGAKVKADGSVLAVGAGEPDCRHFCRSLLKPIETRVEYSQKDLTHPFRCVKTYF